MSTLHVLYLAWFSSIIVGSSFTVMIEPRLKKHRLHMVQVADKDQWIQWASDSLAQAKGQSLFQVTNTTTYEEVHIHSRFAVLSHGIEDDPVFCYANQATLDMFQYDLDEFCQIPSRYSAPESAARTNRQAIMDQFDCENFWIIDRAIRQRKDKSLFEFHNVWLWNVFDPTTKLRVGQSAIIDRDLIVDIDDDWET